MANLDQLKLFSEDGRRNGNTEMVKDWEGNGILMHLLMMGERKGRSFADHWTSPIPARISSTVDVEMYRIFGVAEEGAVRKYVCVSTVRMKRKLMDGGTISSTMVNISVEEESRKKKTFVLGGRMIM